MNLNKGLIFFTKYHQKLIELTDQFDSSEINQDLENFYLAYWQISENSILNQDGTDNLRKSLSITEVWKKSLTDVFKQSLIEVLNKQETNLSNLFEEISESVVCDLLGRNSHYKILEESDNQDHILVFNKVKFLLKQLFNKSIYTLLTVTHIQDKSYSSTNVINEKIKAKLEEFKLKHSHQKFLNRQESQQIKENSKLKSEFELQEFSELCFSCLNIPLEKTQFLEIFTKLKGSYLPGNSFSNSDLINLDRIFDFFRDFDKFYPNNEQNLGLKIELSDLEKGIFVKLLMLFFINKTKQSGNTMMNLDLVTRIIQQNIDSDNAQNLVWQNYLLCLKQRTTITTEASQKEEKPAELSLSDDDYDLLFPEGTNNFAFLEIYLPGGKNNVGRLKIPFVEGENITSYYLHWLKTSGLRDFIDTQILNKLNLETNPEIDTVEFNLIFPDGSLEVTSTDNSKIGVSTDFPIITYEITLNGRRINVVVRLYLIDHHPRVGDKLERDAACLQVLKKFEKIRISEDANIISVVSAVLEEVRAADTDWGTSSSNIYYRYTDPEWYDKRIKEITIVNELINIIDIYNGAPLFEKPPPIDKYTSKVLLLQALLIPKIAYLTVNRGQVTGLKSKEVLAFDKKIFRHFVNFIAEKFPDIESYKDLIEKFYDSSKETLIKNLIAYNKYLRSNNIEQKEVADITNKFKNGYDESVQSQEADIKTFDIKTNPVVKIAIYKSDERRNSRVEMREKSVAVYLLRKNAKDVKSLKKQNYTCGMLLPKENENNGQYIKNIKLVKKLFTEFLDTIYSTIKALPDKVMLFQGGQDCGTRDAGAGTSEFLDNEPIADIFVNRLNQLLASGLPLENISVKSICANIFIDENGVSNDKNMDKINWILSTNELNASLEF